MDCLLRASADSSRRLLLTSCLSRSLQVSSIFRRPASSMADPAWSSGRAAFRSARPAGPLGPRPTDRRSGAQDTLGILPSTYPLGGAGRSGPAYADRRGGLCRSRLSAHALTYATASSEVRDLAADQLERFPALVIFNRSDLTRAGGPIGNSDVWICCRATGTRDGPQSS